MKEKYFRSKKKEKEAELFPLLAKLLLMRLEDNSYKQNHPLQVF